MADNTASPAHVVVDIAMLAVTSKQTWRARAGCARTRSVGIFAAEGAERRSGSLNVRAPQINDFGHWLTCLTIWAST